MEIGANQLACTHFADPVLLFPVTELLDSAVVNIDISREETNPI